MATYGNYDVIPGLIAGQDLSSSQYKLVKIASTAGAVIVGTSATSLCLGVLQNDPTAGQAAEVAYSGICKVLSEDSVTYGQLLMCSTTGRVKTAATANTRIVGYALEAGAAGEIIRMVVGGSNL